VLVALGLAFFVAPFASGWPDGLERVAATLGFGRRAAAVPVPGAPFPGYHFRGIGSAALSTGIAGIAGTLMAFGLAWLLAALLTPHRGAGAGPGGKGEDPGAPRAA
jgi:hypothetical protein